jgi:membrane protein
MNTALKPPSKWALWSEIFKEAFARWQADSITTRAAALSYYTAFSMAPIILLTVALAGLMLGRQAAEGKVMEQLAGLVGPQSAAAIQSMVQAANRRATTGALASVVSIVSLILGAIGVLSELKGALNQIWRTNAPSDLKELVKQNVLYVGFLLGIGFLLAVSLIVSALIAAMAKFAGGIIPCPDLVLQTSEFIFSVGVITLLFAAMFKFLPDTKVRWHDVWLGAALTAIFFNLGKLGLGLYLGRGAVGSAYGAAGSVMIILLWVYYSGLIFYFGAEFTRLYAERFGSRTPDAKLPNFVTASGRPTSQPA